MKSDKIMLFIKRNRATGKTSVVLYAIMYLMCAVNLLAMHYMVVDVSDTEDVLYCRDYIDNAAGVLFDVTLLLLFFLVITCRRLKPALLCCYVVTLLWAFANILYSRFFGQYLMVSAILQVSNLASGFMLDSIGDGICGKDLRFVLSAGVFLLVYIFTPSVRMRSKSMLWFGVMPILTLCYNMYVVAVIAPGNDDDNTFWGNMICRYYSPRQAVLSPQLTNFESGSLRVLAVTSWSTMISSTHLNDDDKREIENEYLNHRNRKTCRPQHPNVRNVIFIIVESYLSLASDMKVGGIEVTPNMNALRRDSNVYYNGKMRSDIAIGESSDGQFIYMTGLLPLNNTITVNKARSVVLPGLPKTLKGAFPTMEARMIIPTIPSFWSQSAMCIQYGFDRLYSTEDYKDGTFNSLNDEQVFDLAIDADAHSEKPFFSVILTMSMHGPYRHTIESDTVLTDPSLSERFCNYLTAVHYTDKQIGRYLNSLKEQGLYDNSLIIIAADHHAHVRHFEMKERLSEDIPLYIINGNVDKDTCYYGSCHQLDVYTTILDILGVDTDWRGLGHTLLNRNYVSSVNENTGYLSESIISGNYFH